MQWYLLGETGTIEIEEQVQKDVTSISRSFLHTRHFSDMERNQIANMLYMRSSTAHRLAQFHVKELNEVINQLRNKRKALEQRICKAEKSLEIFLRQNLLPKESVDIEDKGSCVFLPNCKDTKQNEMKHVQEFQQRMAQVLNFCIEVTQDKERSWKKLDRLRRKLYKSCDTNSKLLANFFLGTDKYRQRLEPNRLNIYADESENCLQKLTALTEQLSNKEIAILQMTFQITNKPFS